MKKRNWERNGLNHVSIIDTARAWGLRRRWELKPGWKDVKKKKKKAGRGEGRMGIEIGKCASGTFKIETIITLIDSTDRSKKEKLVQKHQFKNGL